MLMSYEEYLDCIKGKDTRMNWIYWKIDCYGMPQNEAIKAAYDKEWGYEPLSKS